MFWIFEFDRVELISDNSGEYADEGIGKPVEYIVLQYLWLTDHYLYHIYLLDSTNFYPIHGVILNFLFSEKSD